MGRSNDSIARLAGNPGPGRPPICSVFTNLLRTVLLRQAISCLPSLRENIELHGTNGMAAHFPYAELIRRDGDSDPGQADRRPADMYK